MRTIFSFFAFNEEVDCDQGSSWSFISSTGNLQYFPISDTIDHIKIKKNNLSGKGINYCQTFNQRSSSLPSIFEPTGLC